MLLCKRQRGAGILVGESHSKQLRHSFIPGFLLKFAADEHGGDEDLQTGNIQRRNPRGAFYICLLCGLVQPAAIFGEFVQLDVFGSELPRLRLAIHPLPLGAPGRISPTDGDPEPLGSGDELALVSAGSVEPPVDFPADCHGGGEDQC